MFNALIILVILGKFKGRLGTLRHCICVVVRSERHHFSQPFLHVVFVIISILISIKEDKMFNFDILLLWDDI